MSHELRVDWPACRARGLCFEVLPEIITLDDWGYPVVTGRVTDTLLREAREAVRVCPRLALRLVEGRDDDAAENVGRVGVGGADSTGRRA